MRKENVSKKYKFNGAQLYKNQDEKYLIEIRYLITTNQGWMHLDNHAQQMVIDDAFIKFKEQINKGNVITDDYNDYKGYLFMICKNEYLKLHEKNKVKKRKDRNLYVDELGASLDLARDTEIESQIEITDAMQYFSKNEQQLVKLLLTGYNYKESGEILGINQHRVRKILNKMRSIFFKNFKPTYDRKFGTKTEISKSRRYVGNLDYHYIKETDDDYNDYYAD